MNVGGDVSVADFNFPFVSHACNTLNNRSCSVEGNLSSSNEISR